jgi:hypothetical protein
MLQRLLIITLTLCSLTASAQWQQTGAKVRYVNGLGIPTKDTAAGVAADSSQILIRPADSSLYIKYKRTWVKVGSGGGGGVGGSGTINRVPKFTASTTLGNSSIVDSASAVAMTINPSGNVGIGTATPAVKLDVNGAVNLSTGSSLTWGGIYGANIPTIAGQSGAGAYLQFYPAGSTSSEKVRFHANGAVSVNTTTDNGVDKLQVSGSATISDDLKVQGGDILITSPTATAQFRVQGLSVPTGFDVQSFMTGGTPEAYLWQRDNGPFYFGTNNTERLKITGGGDIGIGTSPSNPSSRLHVNGGTLIVSNVGVTGSQVNIGIGLLTAARPFIGTNTSSNPLEIGTRDAQSTIFVTNSIERVRIVSGGAVLVSTTTDNGVDELQVNGSISGIGFKQAYVTKTGAYTATNDDYVIDCTSGTFTVTLPASSGRTGRILIIKNSGAGTITVDGNGAETIDGAATYSLAVQYATIQIISDGTNWKIISKF